MYRVIDGKGSGKTRQLMQFAKDTDAIFVCSNPQAMSAKAHAYGIVGLELLSYGDYLTLRKMGIDKPTVIDELENFILGVMGNKVNIIGYTLSNED